MENLSDHQNLLVRTVRQGTLKSLREIFDPEDLQKDHGWFDYALLIESLIRNNKSIISYLLKNGCRVRISSRTEIYQTPLCYALEFNNYDIATKLLRKGASITDLDLNTKTPIYLAMEQKKYELLILMLQLSDFENLNPASKSDMEHFYIVCKVNYLGYIKKFILRGFPLNEVSKSDVPECQGSTPLHFAVGNKCLATVRFLLECRANVFLKNSKGLTPLQLAFYNQLYQDNSYIWVISKFQRSEEEDIIKTLLSLHLVNYSNPVDENGLSHFHISCTRNLPDVVQAFIDNGADVNRSLSMNFEKFPGYTPLHLAVYENCLDVAKLLLINGADINKTSKSNQSPLHLACLYNHKTMIEFLVNSGASLVIQDQQGCTPLHVAFYKVPKDNQLVDYLLQKIPKNFNPIDSQGLSHFHIACTTNQLESVGQFMEYNVPVNYYLNSSGIKYSGYSALHFAIVFNRREVVELLLQRNADVRATTASSKLTPLHFACMHSWNKFHELVQADLNCNNADWVKNREDQMKIINMLLAHNSDVNAIDASGMTAALYTCHLNIFHSFCRELSIQLDWEPSLKIQVALKEELYTRCREMINILLNHNVDLNAGTSKCGSVLHVILKENIFNESIDLIQLLLSKGADVNAVNEWGMSLLHIAVIQGNTKVVKILLDSGARVNARTNSSSTPLHLAVGSVWPASKPIIDILLENDGDVDARNMQGETPLHIAFSRKNVYAVKQLFKYGADVNVEDKTGSPTVFSSYDRLNYRDLEWFEIQELIRKNVAMLIALKAYVSSKVRCHCETNLQEDFYEESGDLTVKCAEEIERMRLIQIDKYSSLLDVLMKDQNEMSKRTNNKELKNIAEAAELDSDFPLYGPLLRIKFHRGSIRRTLIEDSMDALFIILNNRLPESCLYGILRFLSNECLESVIQAKDVFCACEKKKLVDTCSCKVNSNKRQRLR